ncbi:MULTISPECIES: CchlQ [Streptomyces]|uniref:CchlQ n=1 Tax=Streptomyces TaxID=1883 RepID=UPI001E5307A8|nr:MULTISPECIES: CchlQ [Streptomyces]UFQ14305.1 CchlQ [Streptomyces huasconensis]WCL83905.1 CchlQ [Streptomyces sp. JCM 35825]
MEWGTLVATLGGGLIAIAGTVLADRLRTRQEHRRSLQARRRDVYTEFITAAGEAHTQLRRLAQNGAGATDLEEASRSALTNARVYEVRERLFLGASSRVAGTGQTMFERLRALRKVVASGAGISTPAFHDIYHPYLDAVWAYRKAVRDELDGHALTPADFGWSAWDGRERCPHCTERAADTAPGRR